MRGKLIFPFWVELAQIDTEATAADPDGAGPLTSGYDDIFREPISIATSVDDPIGEVQRVETTLKVRAQIETRAWDQLEQLFTGSNPNAAIELVFHYRELEEAGLVEYDTGVAKIKVNDRLCAIYDKDSQLVREIPNPPGLYITEVRDSGFGFGGKRNLLIATLQDRDRGTRAL